MDYDLKKKTQQHARNKYEAVIIAAKLARKLNMERLAETENLGPDESIPVHKTKVTTEAINGLAEGKIKYKFREEKHHDEEIFPEI
jgi:DNA-directed RNA polymerase subunit K/omega